MLPLKNITSNGEFRLNFQLWVWLQMKNFMKISKDHNMLQNTVFSTFHCAYSELSRQFYVDKIMWQERRGHVTVTRRFLIQSDRLRSLEFTWTFEFSNFRLKFFTIVKSLPIFECILQFVFTKMKIDKINHVTRICRILYAVYQWEPGSISISQSETDFKF